MRRRPRRWSPTRTPATSRRRTDEADRSLTVAVPWERSGRLLCVGPYAMRASRSAIVLAVVVLATAPRPAAAQTLPVDRRDARGGRSTDPAGGPGPRAGDSRPGPGMLERRRLARTTRRRPSCCATPASSSVLYDPIAHRLGADLTAGVGLGIASPLGLDVPVFLYQDGTSRLPATIAIGGHGAHERHRRHRHPTARRRSSRNDHQGIAARLRPRRPRRRHRPHRRRESFHGDGAATVSLRLLARVRARPGRGAREPRLHAAHADADVARRVASAGVTFGDVDPVVASALSLRPKAVFHALDAGRPPVLGARRPRLAPRHAGRAVRRRRAPPRSRPRMLALDDRIAARPLPRRVRPRRRRPRPRLAPSACPSFRGIARRRLGPARRTTATATASPTTSTSARTCPRTSTASRTRTAAPRTTPTATASSTSTTPARSCPGCGGTTRRRTAAPRPTPTATASPTSRRVPRGQGRARATTRRRTAARVEAHGPRQGRHPRRRRPLPRPARGQGRLRGLRRLPRSRQRRRRHPRRGGRVPEGEGRAVHRPDAQRLPEPRPRRRHVRQRRRPVPRPGRGLQRREGRRRVPRRGRAAARRRRRSKEAAGTLRAGAAHPARRGRRPPDVDPKSAITLRAIALELNQHPDWTLGVGVRPGPGKPEDGAAGVARARDRSSPTASRPSRTGRRRPRRSGGTP